MSETATKSVALTSAHLYGFMLLLGAGPITNLATNLRGPAAEHTAKLSEDGDFKVLVVEVRGIAGDVKEIKDDQGRQKDRAESLWQRYNDQQSVIANIIRDNREQDEKIKTLQGGKP